MTQLEEATALVAKITGIVGTVITPLGDALKQLDDVVDRAQNEPPTGEADGTITSEKWLLLRDFAEQGRAALESIPRTQ